MRFFALLWALGTPAQALSNPWTQAKTPAQGPAEAIGGYSAGCLRGALELSSSPLLQPMRPSRRRAFGHPELIAMIFDAAQKAAAKDFGTLLVGDISQPRGGPTTSLHASHQLGLDVDIWYWQPPKGATLSDEDREKLSAPNMVVPVFEGLSKNWRPETIELLKIFAQEDRVQRILVDPVIKREACKAAPGQAWVGKLRPWWGHDDHFHVRIRCPDSGSPQCEPQETVPPGDGCDGSLAEWFSPENRRHGRERAEHPPVSQMPALPPRCEEVLYWRPSGPHPHGFWIEP